MSLEERKTQYAILYWPSENMPNDEVGSGRSPATLSLDSNWGTIRIDLGGREAVKQ